MIATLVGATNFDEHDELKSSAYFLGVVFPIERLEDTSYQSIKI